MTIGTGSCTALTAGTKFAAGLKTMLPLISGPRQDLGQTKPLDFIRHGSTKFNTTVGDTPPPGSMDRIRGHLDIPLDDRGREEAKKAGRKLCDLKAKPAMLVSSDLSRSVETAHIISRMCGIPVGGSLPSLRPWNLGKLQGQESATVAPIMTRLAHNPDQPAPGGGDSFHQFLQQFFGGLKQILAHPQRIAIVAHHRNERAIAAMEKGNWQYPDLKEFARHGDAPGA